MEKDYKELVSMIDNLIKKGSGHINVKNGNNQRIENVISCDLSGTACSVPTLHEGIDE